MYALKKRVHNVLRMHMYSMIVKFSVYTHKLKVLIVLPVARYNLRYHRIHCRVFRHTDILKDLLLT